MGAEVENGRIVRLMTKLGFINERAEYVNFPFPPSPPPQKNTIPVLLKLIAHGSGLNWTHVGLIRAIDTSSNFSETMSSIALEWMESQFWILVMCWFV